MATKRASGRTTTKRATPKRAAGKRGSTRSALAPVGRDGGVITPRRGKSRELMKPAKSAWTNALGKKRVKTASKPGDKTYANKVEFRCRNPKNGEERVYYHKARAKVLNDKGWECMAYERPRPETNPQSKLYKRAARG